MEYMAIFHPFEGLDGVSNDIFDLFSTGLDLRRQNMTSKVDPRNESITNV